MIAGAILVAAGALATSAPQQDLAALERSLRDRDEQTRREAVQGLARLATPEAWSLVIDALRDPAPRVADEAQIHLGEIASPAVLADFVGKRCLASGDDFVRLRAAEALGRIPIAIEPGVLVRGLKEKDPELRRTYLWSAERRARSGDHTYSGAKLATAIASVREKDADPGVRAAACTAARALGADRDELWKEALDDGATEVLCAVLLVEIEASSDGRDEPTEAESRFAALATSEHRAVRRLAAEGLGRERDVPAVTQLAAMLEREPNRRLAWEIVEHLRAASGLKHGLDVRPWRDWVAALPADWRPATAPARPKRDDTDTRTSFVGLPILSQRVAILIDFSGSLWEDRGGGRTRKQKADVELRRTLESLAPDTAFNVIPYTEDPLPWQKALAPATPANVAKALAYFEGCKAKGKGDFWDALCLALADPEVDTVLVLTDGAPSGGRRWNLELMGELFAERNRFRQVALDAVLVDAGRIERFWERMCAASGGRVLAVDL